MNATNTPHAFERAPLPDSRAVFRWHQYWKHHTHQQGVFVADDPLRPRLEPWRETAQQRAELLAVWKNRGVALASATVAYNLVN